MYSRSVYIKKHTHKMSLSLIQSKNLEIIDIVKDIPGLVDTVYEKMKDDHAPLVRKNYIGVPGILVNSGQEIHDTLNLSSALCYIVSHYMWRNPSLQSNDELNSCINVICNEIQLLRNSLKR